MTGRRKVPLLLHSSYYYQRQVDKQTNNTLVVTLPQPELETELTPEIEAMNQPDRSAGSEPVKVSIGCRQKLMALHREVRKELGTLPNDDADAAGDKNVNGFASAKKMREIEEAPRALMEENKLLRRTAEAAIKKADGADAVLKSLFQSSTVGEGSQVREVVASKEGAVARFVNPEVDHQMHTTTDTMLCGLRRASAVLGAED